MPLLQLLAGSAVVALSCCVLLSAVAAHPFDWSVCLVLQGSGAASALGLRLHVVNNSDGFGSYTVTEASGWREFAAEATAESAAFHQRLAVHHVAPADSISGNLNVFQPFGEPPFALSGLGLRLSGDPVVSLFELDSTSAVQYNSSADSGLLAIGYTYLYELEYTPQDSTQRISNANINSYSLSLSNSTDEVEHCGLPDPHAALTFSLCGVITGSGWASAVSALITALPAVGAAQLNDGEGNSYQAIAAQGWRAFRDVVAVNGMILQNLSISGLSFYPTAAAADVLRQWADPQDFSYYYFEPPPLGYSFGLDFSPATPLIFGLQAGASASALLYSHVYDGAYLESVPGYYSPYSILSSRFNLSLYTGPGSELNCELPDVPVPPPVYQSFVLCAQFVGYTWATTVAVSLNTSALLSQPGLEAYQVLAAQGWRYFTDNTQSPVAVQNATIPGLADSALLSGVSNIVNFDYYTLDSQGLGLLLSELPLTALSYNGSGPAVDGLYTGIAAGTVSAIRLFNNLGQYGEQVSKATSEAAAVSSTLYLLYSSEYEPVSLSSCPIATPSYSTVTEHDLCATFQGPGFASATAARLTVLQTVYAAYGYGDLVVAASGWRAFHNVIDSENVVLQNLTVTGVLPPDTGAVNNDNELFPDGAELLDSLGLALQLSGVPAVYGYEFLTSSSSLSYILLSQQFSTEPSEGFGYLGYVNGLYIGYASEPLLGSSSIALRHANTSTSQDGCMLPEVQSLPTPSVSSYTLCAQLVGETWATLISAELEARGPYPFNPFSPSYRIIGATGYRLFSDAGQYPAVEQNLSITGVAVAGRLFDNNNLFRLSSGGSSVQPTALDAQGVVFRLDGIPLLPTQNATNGSSKGFVPQPLISLRELTVVNSALDARSYPVESDAAGFEAPLADEDYIYDYFDYPSRITAARASSSVPLQCALPEPVIPEPQRSASFFMCLVVTGPSYASVTQAVLNTSTPVQRHVNEYSVLSAVGHRLYRERLWHGGVIHQNLSIHHVAAPYSVWFNDNLLYYDAADPSGASQLDYNGLVLTFKHAPYVYGAIHDSTYRGVKSLLYVPSYAVNYTELLVVSDSKFSSDFAQQSAQLTLTPYTDGDDESQCVMPPLQAPPRRNSSQAYGCVALQGSYWASAISVTVSVFSTNPRYPLVTAQPVFNAAGWRYYIDTSQQPAYVENRTITGVAAVGSINGNDNLVQLTDAYGVSIDTRGLAFTLDAVPTVFQPRASNSSAVYRAEAMLAVAAEPYAGSIYSESNADGFTGPGAAYESEAVFTSYDAGSCYVPQPAYAAPLSSSLWSMCATFQGAYFMSATFVLLNATEPLPFQPSGHQVVSAQGWRLYLDTISNDEQNVSITALAPLGSIASSSYIYNDNQFEPLLTPSLDTGGLAFLTSQEPLMYGISSYVGGPQLLLSSGYNYFTQSVTYLEGNADYQFVYGIASADVTFAPYTGPGSEVSCELPGEALLSLGDNGVAAVLAAARLQPPVFNLNFSTDPAYEVGGYIYWNWAEVSGSDSAAEQQVHRGLAQLDNDYTWIDLTTDRGPFSASVVLPTIGGAGSGTGRRAGWSFEVVFQPQLVADWAKLFCFGDGESDSDITLGWYGLDYGKMAVQLYHGDSLAYDYAYGLTELPSWIQLDEWYHVVIVMQPVDAAVDSAVWRVYVNGQLQDWAAQLVPNSTLTPLQGANYPAAVARPYSYIGRSDWDDPKWAGLVDSLRIYDYALDSDTIWQLAALYNLNLSSVTPAPGAVAAGLLQALNATDEWSVAAAAGIEFKPVLNLPFSVDPTPFVGGSTAYSWLQVDSTDNAAQQQQHSGLMQLAGAFDQYIDLNALSGPQSVGQVTPVLFGRSSGSNSTAGWTVELVFKPLLYQMWSKFFCLSTGTDVDALYLGWQDDNGVLEADNIDNTPNVADNGPAVPLQVLLQPTLGVWYHVALALHPAHSEQPHLTNATYTVYVNGREVANRTGLQMPLPIYRQASYIGKSAWQADATFKPWSTPCACGIDGLQGSRSHLWPPSTAWTTSARHSNAHCDTAVCSAPQQRTDELMNVALCC